MEAGALPPRIERVELGGPDRCGVMSRAEIVGPYRRAVVAVHAGEFHSGRCAPAALVTTVWLSSRDCFANALVCTSQP